MTHLRATRHVQPFGAMRFPCRARLRLQAQTVPQADSMLPETPAAPYCALRILDGLDTLVSVTFRFRSAPKGLGWPRSGKPAKESNTDLQCGKVLRLAAREFKLAWHTGLIPST
jgi:hypothetical protein